MPFNNEILEKATKEMTVQSVGSDFEIAQELITRAIENIAGYNGNVMPDAVDIYLHGSYANKTNTYFASNMEIMVELKRTLRYNPADFPHAKYALYNNYFVETVFDFNPVDFKNLLFEELHKLTDGKVEMQSKWIKIVPHGDIKHKIEITPSFLFNFVEAGGTAKEKIFGGVLLFDDRVGAHIVSFPKLHASNGRGKNIATGGMFLKMVRLFKTINKIGIRESEFGKTRGYFVECLLFNVPNNVYIASTTEEAFYKVLNYLGHVDLVGFASQNLVWQLFGETAEFWNVDSARKFITNVKKLHDTFPVSRTQLV